MNEAGLSVLAVEPWLGGSHARFLEGWCAHSRHRIEVLGLPPRHWRWRMEGAALTLAERAMAAGPPPDVLVVSDYLDLARFRGLLPPAWHAVPALAYFHENQLTFPTAPDSGGDPDLSPGFCNVLSVIAAEDCVFNSRFHLEDFSAAARRFVRHLPRPRPAATLEAALSRAGVVHPGVDLEAHPLGPGPDEGAPLQVGWCHRWEHDKDPAAFLRAILEASSRGADMELVLLGDTFERTPPGTSSLLSKVAPLVRHQGYAEGRASYARLLGSCDLVVSTARHEFYGISTLEAVATGCGALAPRALAYPETLTGELANGLYEGHEQLVAALVTEAASPRRARGDREKRRAAIRAHDVARTAALLDERCVDLGASR